MKSIMVLWHTQCKVTYVLQKMVVIEPTVIEVR